MSPCNYDLVGGFNPSEKISISCSPYSQYMEKYKMFQTTNQDTTSCLVSFQPKK